MIFFSEIEIEKLVVHSVGNKLKGDSILCSDSTVVLGSELEDVLLKYFINPFKPNEFYNLANIEHNEVYLSVKQIFSNSNNFIAESQKIARRLFEETRNPKVAGGNLFIVYFNKCIINDELTNAVGIFKSEISETFLKIKPSNERFSIEREAGINISKMTKGCMIYAYEESDGYLVSIIDKRSKKEEVSYWSDNFLNLVPREDEYFQTKYTLSCIENYISNAMPEQFEISRADQADLLNKTLEYFKENDDFNREVYSEEVFQNIEITNSFSEF